MLIEPYGMYDESTAQFRIGDTLYKYDTRSSEPFKIPYGVTEIDSDFFEMCEDLREPPIIPNTVKWIGNRFLYACYSLEKTPSIPNSVTATGDNFLYECTHLTHPPIIPDSVIEIGNYFLGWCEGLEKAPRIPLSVTTISYNFLCGCESLREPPRIPDSVTSIDSDGFLDACRGIDILAEKWNIECVPTPFNCKEYWRKKDTVRANTLAHILDLPYHIFEEYT